MINANSFASSDGYSGTGGYTASFGTPGPEALGEQRTRLQQRSSRGEEASTEEDVGESDWAVSYADMVTLLMAFFVILTSSAVNAPALEAASGAVPNAAYEQSISSTASILDGKGISIADIGRPANQDDVLSPYDDPEAMGGTTDAAPSGEGVKAQEQPPPASENPLATQLQALVQQNDLGGQVEVLSTAQSVTVRISDRILFSSGRALLEDGGSTLVQRLSGILAQTASSGGVISIEGHTDPIPIRTAQFPSNWELSAARAAMVVRELIARGLPASQLRAIGYADTRPVADNATLAGRAANRRVELVITSEPKR